MKGMTDRRILVVEPDEAIRDMVSLALRQKGHAVSATAEGRDAVAAMERESFSCIVIGSPVTLAANGSRMLLLEYLEKHCPEWRPCIVVITTFIEDARLLSVAARLEVCALFAKPFAPHELVDVVEGCAAGRHPQSRWFGIPERLLASIGADAEPVAAGPRGRSR